ncbi:uncharacterized protein LOC115706018 [Cannabis sativa]|uniref:Uncharacterized protein n=1 Tax=Cannabis sativa TaxID=3483 RepID=A0A7J6HXG4_CANSA|nr:uncharacterized protein LOC115706018 [Cannabis sativa]KAF4368053.1 hypothetical protein F8388_002664 [Cannabis sativa]KAF4399983.1 hypothetical protein G4B88_021197 [Cannabis sativa]
MEDLCSPFNWNFRHEGEGMEELWYSLLCTTVELETQVESAKEEITKKEDEILILNEFLSRAIKEKEEAESNCQSIMLDIVTLKKQLHQAQKEQPIAPHNGLGEPTKESQNHFADQIFASSCETKENEVSNESCEDNNMDSILQPPLLSSSSSSLSSELPPGAEQLVAGKPLPEKGKLLQAVMEAGPLLQTLLLAGPLPQWQHPPPLVNCVEIPPVAISRPLTQSFLGQEEYSCLSHNNKRSLPHYEGCGFNSSTKYQKVVLY